MPWEKDTTSNIEYYRQDSTMGCAFSCAVSATKWVNGKTLDEDHFRSKAVNGSLTIDADASKSTSGANLLLVKQLAGTVPLVTSDIMDLDEVALKKAQAEASLEDPLLLGVVWKDSSKHLVLCVGKDPKATDKVLIVDPGIGVQSINPGLLYQPTGYDGAFDGKAVEIHFGG